MKDFSIYLAGGMSHLSLEEQTRWRLQIQNAIKYGDYDLGKNVNFFDPTQYFSVFDEHTKESQKEAMDFDLYNLKRSDLMIVNFNNPLSIGSAMEVMLAKINGIPVIGLNVDGCELHPWLIESTNKMFTDMRNLVDYVVNFYLK
jgi:hypothetical protein